MGKNHRGFADLTHTNMCYRCEYCQQGFNQIYHLQQIAIEWFICSNCRHYYNVSIEDVLNLKYVETKEEWREAGVSIFFPYPMGFNEDG
jgi:hypothetical protein|tara:strand:- start:1684 stop:1950 length:267 start_codon:yes stop_codon:yes gene_type:complete